MSHASEELFECAICKLTGPEADKKRKEDALKMLLATLLAAHAQYSRQILVWQQNVQELDLDIRRVQEILTKMNP